MNDDGNYIVLQSYDKKPYDAKIIRIIVHPKYKSPKRYFDIALMELGTEVKFSSDIQPACLWSEHNVLKYGGKAEIAGWGVVRSGTYFLFPPMVMHVHL